jgi:hypothetical protein
MECQTKIKLQLEVGGTHLDRETFRNAALNVCQNAIFTTPTGNVFGHFRLSEVHVIYTSRGMVLLGFPGAIQCHNKLPEDEGTTNSMMRTLNIKTL